MPTARPAAAEPVEGLDEIKRLLSACELPTSDISPSRSLLFYGCYSEGKLIGVVGLEVYGPVALLRSLAVAPSHRSHGRGRSLVAFAEAQAASLGVESLYLLTTTAEGFFLKLGYSTVSREGAPPSIRTTTQFSSLCPAFSTLMSKRPRN